MRYTNVKYPIEEGVAESWRRFNRIYGLTADLADKDINTFRQSTDIIRAWETIANVWESYAPGWGNVDIFYEALFHNCFRKFSSKVSESKMLKLILLVEDELLRCGYAFDTWKNMKTFRSAYKEILYPANNKSRECVKRWKLRWYLQDQMLKHVLLKNKYPEEWGDKLNCTSAVYPYNARELRSNIEKFENSIKFLIPKAKSWNDRQWADESLILREIKSLYGVDFSDDLESLDNLLAAVLYREHVETYSYYLYRINDFPVSLAQHFWSAQYFQKIQDCFIAIYKRYKRARKNTKNSRYRQDRVVNGWLYKQIAEWYNDPMVALSDKVRKAYFEISIGV